MKEIQLTRGCVALVDDEDFEALSCRKWHTDEKGYAVRKATENKKKITIRMHREILGTPKGLETDHVNGRKSDNQKHNLRMATLSENQRNKATYKNNKLKLKGVWLRKGQNKYCAQIKVAKKTIWLGTFQTAQAAHKAYCEAAMRLHGEFCPTFIETTYLQSTVCCP